MTDATFVEFPKLNWSFNIPSTAFEFSLFGNDISVKWYGIIIAFGFILAVLFGGRMAFKWKMSIDKMLDVLIFGTVGGIVGARLFYVFSEWDYYSKHPMDIIKTWEGGLAIYGGLIGGILAAFIVCRVRKLNFLNLLDMAGMSFLIGQGIGRWGNFMNQEAFGTNTNLPWGMTSQKVVDYINANQASFAERGITMDPNIPVHPTFLYESLWCLLGFVVLYIVTRKWRKFSGQIILMYGVWYGFERMIVEGLRTDSLYLGNTNIRTSQLLSALIMLTCLVLLIYFMVKYTKHPKPIEGIDYYLDKNNEIIPMKKALAVNVESVTIITEEIETVIEEDNIYRPEALDDDDIDAIMQDDITYYDE